MLWKFDYLCNKKTKPDSLTNQGLPGINSAKIGDFYQLSKQITIVL